MEFSKLAMVLATINFIILAAIAYAVGVSDPATSYILLPLVISNGVVMAISRKQYHDVKSTSLKVSHDYSK